MPSLSTHFYDKRSGARGLHSQPCFLQHQIFNKDISGSGDICI